MTTQLANHPASFAQTFADNFNTGDIDRVVSFYAADAVLDLGGGNVFAGHNAIRTALTNFLAPKLPITVQPHTVTVSGDTAVVMFNWSIRGIDPEGNPVAMAGRAVDVLRQDAAGWRQLIDLPFGGNTEGPQA